MPMRQREIVLRPEGLALDPTTGARRDWAAVFNEARRRAEQPAELPADAPLAERFTLQVVGYVEHRLHTEYVVAGKIVLPPPPAGPAAAHAAPPPREVRVQLVARALE